MIPVSNDHGGSESARLHRLARELSVFRSRVYGRLVRRADALFELCYALLTAGSVAFRRNANDCRIRVESSTW